MTYGQKAALNTTIPKKKDSNASFPTVKPKNAQSNPAYELARRCQGFFPINSLDINRLSQNFMDISDKDERFQEAGKACVREFLFKEMKMTKRVSKDLRIKKVFFPKAGMAPAIMYAEFWTEEEAEIVKRYAKNFETIEGHRPMLIPYIPLSLYPRYKAVEEEAYKIRKRDRNSTTRIWIAQDFELRVRERGSNTPWANIPPELLTNLPSQAPRKQFKYTDSTDKLTPPTPGYQTHLQPMQPIHTQNFFQFLREEEA